MCIQSCRATGGSSLMPRGEVLFTGAGYGVETTESRLLGVRRMALRWPALPPTAMYALIRI